MIANGFFLRKHHYSLKDFLTHDIVKNRQDKVKFEPDWMVEALKICAFTSGV